MPTFSAIALDRLLDPGASKSLTSTTKNNNNKDNNNINNNDDSNSRLNTTSSSNDLRSYGSKKVDIPPPHPRPLRRTTTAPAEKAPTMRPQMSPALYATPESTPLPDSPTSFPPSSPYIINHKRRGPRLMKSFSERNVLVASGNKKEGEGDEGEGKAPPMNGHSRSLSVDTVLRDVVEVENGSSNGEFGHRKVGMDGELREEIGNGEANVAAVGECLERDCAENDDFFDPQDSMSVASNTDGEECSAAAKLSASGGEFFDAAEELSSDSGRQPQRTITDVEIELREMRLSLLMEIERRKQAEEALNVMRSQWEIVREKLTSAGLILPADLSDLSNSQSDIDPAEDICRQIHVARFVSESIGRGVAKAEAEAEMEAQLEVKNFEIARLSDRLNYYEAMNREMSQRNQEAIEAARSQRQKRRRRRQKWVWGSIAAAITIGSTALAWSYIPSGRGSSSSDSLEASKADSNLQ